MGIYGRRKYEMFLRSSPANPKLPLKGSMVKVKTAAVKQTRKLPLNQILIFPSAVNYGINKNLFCLRVDFIEDEVTLYNENPISLFSENGIVRNTS